MSWHSQFDGDNETADLAFLMFVGSVFLFALTVFVGAFVYLFTGNIALGGIQTCATITGASALLSGVMLFTLKTD